MTLHKMIEWSQANGWTGIIRTRDEAERAKLPPQTAPAVATITASPFTWKDPATIPQREWLYGTFLIRRQVALTVAPGGTGKSSLVAVEALAMATGLLLLQDKPHQRARVWLWNGEDPADELQRRITAAALHYKIAPEAFADHLFVDSGRQTKMVIARAERNGVTIAVPVVDALVATIRDNKIDVVVIDPFISCHEVPENDNGAIDKVAKTYADIAELTGCCISLVHHSRKTGGEAVEIEHSRGAVALIAAARSARTLNSMTEDEARLAGIGNRFAYARIDDGKANLAPRSDRANWIKIQSQYLGNGPHGFAGDSVAVATRWNWPNPSEGITSADIVAAQQAVAAGLWRENVQARDWVGIPIASALGLDIDKPADKAKIKGLLRQWVASGAFVIVMRKDDKGNERPCVEVGKAPTVIAKLSVESHLLPPLPY